MRLPGLDLLRGICALAVAAYHVLYWQSEAKLYAWGTYGVYVFFVLSGASMVVAYAGRLSSGQSLAAFLGLRLARLMPLYVLTVLVGLLLQIYRQASLNNLPFGSVFLNLFFLFGAGNPGSVSRVVGGWSLGIEFVFYLMFPVLLALAMTRLWWGVLAVAFVTQHVFVHSVLGNGKDLVENWVLYTQFLSFIFYFLAGCVIGRLVLMQRLRATWFGPILLALSLIVLGISSRADAVRTLTGTTGLLLSLVAALSVVAASQCDLQGFSRRVADTFGKSSYGVYILHPLFYALFNKAAREQWVGDALVLPLTLTSSFLFALMLEKWFERPIQDYAKRRLTGCFTKRQEGSHRPLTT